MTNLIRSGRLDKKPLNSLYPILNIPEPANGNTNIDRRIRPSFRLYSTPKTQGMRTQKLLCYVLCQRQRRLTGFRDAARSMVNRQRPRTTMVLVLVDSRSQIGS